MVVAKREAGRMPLNLMRYVALICAYLVGTCSGLSAPHMTVESVSQIIAETLQTSQGEKSQRYASVREMAAKESSTTPRNELVYGELSVSVLAELVDAVGVEDNDAFLDIGSGDGALVLGAAMLYPDQIRVSRGLELVPGLVSRSQAHAQQLESQLTVPVEFTLGNVHQADQDLTLQSILNDSTLAVCFATTWSADNATPEQKTSLKGRSLPKLSEALNHMPIRSRILVIDGRLNAKDGYRWEGDMQITCPDTAPFSIASLYERR